MRPGLAKAVFAGGCFWCMEPAFEHVKGVVSATSGYTGGHTANPTYEDVSSGGTGHYEAVEVLYDPNQITYAQLLDVFWRNIDPTNARGQFCDEGDQYRSAIFYGNDAERQLAEQSARRIVESRKLTIATSILPASTFYPAEEYHQDFYKKNPVRYKFYRFNCGRDRRLAQLWGKR
jgi:peptide-methionine (S)-S-oxide reductase